MNRDHSSERRVGRRELIRRIGVGGAVAATGIVGFTTQVAASHTEEPTIDIPDEQTARDHPRFNNVIKINEAYLPEGGYITVVENPNDKEKGEEGNVRGQSIIELPAGHFRNSSVVVPEAPENDEYVDVKAIILKGNKEPYVKGKPADAGEVNF